ncbi:UNVERIFIED_CONTAM: hypothetical protein Sradi_3981900 [Sesamum radiatum]|uniref:Reverse transcriptase domain-containing protein n=1 Tax=Sesamum radiatum TaxID=300843 RepID=A0AAW2PGE6_SESRA
MDDKMSTLISRGTWELVEPPPNADVVACRWVFTLKFWADGTFDRFSWCQADHVVFVETTGSGMVILAVYVNDILIIGSDLVGIEEAKAYLRKHSVTKDLGRTRPDISFVVGLVSQFMDKPRSLHWEDALRILNYIKASPGARGLRQGHPMSPYLFVPVMEVLQLLLRQTIEQDEGFTFHWKREDIGLFQLSFADDLILFYHADTSSVGVFKRGLDRFSTYSGLHANPQKSHLIVSKSAHDTRANLLQILGFEEDTLPLRYLGLPLISSRLTLLDCKPLLQKIDNRIAGWEGIQLSFAGRLQLIKLVLMALEVYWVMAFILPKGILKEVEKRLYSFLWKGTSNSGYPKVA